ncbi:MAG: hypothetical protein K6B64_04630 [Acholeplasmatales bacterium]|nr:hypothetical protein [Acholeplasmatales bacterium]
MSTFVTIALITLAVVGIVYLYKVLSEADMDEKGKCNAKDYEIADKIAAKKNN